MAGRRRAKASTIKRYESSRREYCEDCKEDFDSRGFSRHLAGCDARKERLEQEALAEALATKRHRIEDFDDVTRTPKKGRHSRQMDPIPFQLQPPLQQTGVSEDQALSAHSGFEERRASDLQPQIVWDHSQPSGSAYAEPPHGHRPVSGPTSPHSTPEPSSFPTAVSSTASPLSPIPTAPRSPTTPVISTTLPTPAPTPALDDIKIEYHHASGRSTKLYSFADFTRDEPVSESDLLDDEHEPWWPFNSRLDFEFAELAHETRMNKEQIKRLLEIVAKVASSNEKFTLETVDDVNTAWEKARFRYPSFQLSKYPVTYKNEEHVFEFYHRPLWPWLMSQVQDPLLAKHYRWDAQRLYKYDGTEWVRFYDEPWTAESFWNAQSNIMTIDPDGKPFAIILWADTAKLSTFGTKKGHFIIARSGNLPEFVRNGSSIGSGRVVGFIPLIEVEDPAHKGKTTYINFKHEVYHAAFREFLKEVAVHSKYGYYLECGDCILRSLFPYIHIVSADYEEQCYFCLIRGLHGLAPCPVCLIKKDSLSDLKTKHPYRDASEARALVEKEEPLYIKEEALKPRGLRNVKNALWDIENTDIHVAVSFDRLHAYSIGLFSSHLMPQLKAIVDNLGRSATVKIERSVNNVPRWSGLTHFKSILDVEYNDGSKWSDISKIIVNVTHHVLTEETSPKGFALLKLIRKFVELDCLVSLEVQTTKTIAGFSRTLDAFHDRLQEYKNECRFDENPKDWDAAIKVHSHAHAARDIVMKGVISNMDTKPNERLNGPMRKAYQLQTNFKNVEHQLGRIEDKSLASCTIRAHLQALDEANTTESINQESDEPKESAYQFNNVYLGSRNPMSVGQFIHSAGSDKAFTSFKARLSARVDDLREREGLSSIPVSDADKIVDCGYLKVDFESSVSWRLSTNLLRCTAEWSKDEPRYDTVIVNDGDSGIICCKLVRIFTYTHTEEQRPYALILVQPLNAPTGNRSANGDFQLGICRVREKSRTQSRILPARSIIRGVVVVPDPDHRGEYTLVDALDSDIFLRCMNLFPNRDTVNVG